MDHITQHTPPLELRPLGGTGIFVSPIGLGTVKLGRNQGVKYPHPFALPTDEQVRALLARAADVGVNLIDTAPAYGTSEERLGELLSGERWFGSRMRWVISSKAGEEFEQGVSRFDFSAGAIRASVLRSLRRLRTDYLDVVLIHSSGDDSAILADGQAVSELCSLKREGKIRAIGMSTKTVEGGLLALGVKAQPHIADTSVVRHGRWCDVLMVSLNQSDASQLPVIREAARAGAGILIKKAFESGHVASQSHGNHAATTIDERLPQAAMTDADPIRRALAFVFDQGGDAVSSVVGGTVNPDHLENNVQVVTELQRQKR
ncbi:MAG: aldo/keto reductase [Pyrinomonadaceae bacterium]|nr:aldo/keto reductase [Phycisphaerales bacterium]